MAIMERTVLDRRNGRPINAHMADYLVPVNLDTPHIEAHFVDEEDTIVNPLGVKGLGESRLWECRRRFRTPFITQPEGACMNADHDREPAVECSRFPLLIPVRVTGMRVAASALSLASFTAEPPGGTTSTRLQFGR